MGDIKRLDELIPSYCLNKSEFDSYKKLCEKENAEIKALMKEQNVSDYRVDGYTVKYVIVKKETINEEKLLEIAHIHGIPEIVKTKEYIDFGALENAIYNGKIEASIIAEMNTAKEVKEVETLRISKNKE